jgi:hypothetical protein
MKLLSMGLCKPLDGLDVREITEKHLFEFTSFGPDQLVASSNPFP